jgi:RNA polymerase sigma-70 factor (ECF subfamily)
VKKLLFASQNAANTVRFGLRIGCVLHLAWSLGLAGEKQLFHELIRPCERPIYFLLISILRNEAEAEDAAQETVLKIYRNLHLFRGESQFRTWALSIARNEGLGRLRKAETRREDSLDALSDDQAGDFTPAILTSWREVPSQALEQKELAFLLRQAIDGLPEIYRNVVLLRDIEEMDVRETAAALGITEGAVKVRLHRARLESAFGELIVTGGWLMAAGTDCRRTLARTHSDLNTLVIGTETGIPVNESRKTVAAV